MSSVNRYGDIARRVVSAVVPDGEVGAFARHVEMACPGSTVDDALVRQWRRGGTHFSLDLLPTLLTYARPEMTPQIVAPFLAGSGWGLSRADRPGDTALDALDTAVATLLAAIALAREEATTPAEGAALSARLIEVHRAIGEAQGAPLRSVK